MCHLTRPRKYSVFHMCLLSALFRYGFIDNYQLWNENLAFTMWKLISIVYSQLMWIGSVGRYESILHSIPTGKQIGRMTLPKSNRKRCCRKSVECLHFRHNAVDWAADRICAIIHVTANWTEKRYLLMALRTNEIASFQSVTKRNELKTAPAISGSGERSISASVKFRFSKDKKKHSIWVATLDSYTLHTFSKW